MIQPGQVLANRYRVERVIGAGAMATVLAATHIHLGQRVAIKVLLPEIVQNAAACERFVREARHAAQLTTEHVARVLDVGTVDDGNGVSLYMVMEYLEGRDLQQLLDAQGPVPVAIAADQALQVLQAMAEAHRLGIIHRDLKPANCFLTRRADGRPLVKVLDFGVAKASLEQRVTQTAAIMGSPSYMAPEQMRSSHLADARSDIWSVGVILYQLVSAQLPFVAPSLPELAMRVMKEPPRPLPGPANHQRDALAAVIRRCLAKDPAARFQNVAELAAVLAPLGSRGADQAALQVERILRPVG